MKSLIIPLFALTLVACSGDDGDTGATGTTGATGADGTQGTQGDAGATGPEGPVATDEIYQVTVTNLTNNQPLSPAAIIAHSTGYSAFNDGESASMSLEELAESGDNSELLFESLIANNYLDHVSTGLISPRSDSGTVWFRVPNGSSSDLRLTVLSMLVNTNDAFTGLDEANISDMAVGDSTSFNGPTWDAGTEENSETAGTIPGPAGGGEGFNSARETIDRVSFHSGVVTADDGLATSALNETHRFDNPTSRITVSRTQ